jgi:hypothetical protein
MYLEPGGVSKARVNKAVSKWPNLIAGFALCIIARVQTGDTSDLIIRVRDEFGEVLRAQLKLQIWRLH